MHAGELDLLYSHARGTPRGTRTRTATNADAIAAVTGAAATAAAADTAAATAVTARRVLGLGAQARRVQANGPVRGGAPGHGRGRRLLDDPVQGGPHHVADERGCPPRAPHLSCETKKRIG